MSITRDDTYISTQLQLTLLYALIVKRSRLQGIGESNFAVQYTTVIAGTPYSL